MASSGWQGDVTLQSGGFGYDYFKGNLRIDSITHSGNTVTVTGAFGVHNTGGYSSYYVYPINAAVNGSTGYQQVVAGNQWIGTDEWVTSSVTFSFTAAASATSANIEVLWNYNNGTASNSITYTLYFDASQSPPSGASMSYVSSTYNSITVKGKVTNWGMGYSGTPSRHFAILSSNSTSSSWTGRKEKNVDGTSTSDSQVTISNSNYDAEYDGGIDIKGCLDFKVGMWYGTSVGSGQVGDYTLRHLPPAPLQDISRREAPATGSTDQGKASVTFTITGGTSSVNHNKTVTTQYRTKYGSNAWSNWQTLGTGAPWDSLQVTMKFPYSTNVVIQARQVYESLNSEVKELSFTTIRPPLYGSVNGLTKPIRKLYGSVNGRTVLIKKLYASVNGQTVLIYKDQ